MKRFLFKL